MTQADRSKKSFKKIGETYFVAHKKNRQCYHFRFGFFVWKNKFLQSSWNSGFW